jgi:hypothetical protein
MVEDARTVRVMESSPGKLVLHDHETMKQPLKSAGSERGRVCKDMREVSLPHGRRRTNCSCDGVRKAPAAHKHETMNQPASSSSLQRSVCWRVRTTPLHCGVDGMWLHWPSPSKLHPWYAHVMRPASTVPRLSGQCQILPLPI